MNKFTIEITCDDDWDKDKLQEHIQMIADVKITKITKKTKTRTNQQSKAIYTYFRLLADECLNKGVDIHTLLSTSIRHPVTPEVVKHQMWAKVQKDKYNTDSTAKLKRHEVTEIHAILNNYTAEAHGIDIPFPSELNIRS